MQVEPTPATDLPQRPPVPMLQEAHPQGLGTPVAVKADTAWVHAVRALAVCMVVLLHTSAEAFYLGAKLGTYRWWVANIYDSSMRVAVPLFFMLTGHLLLATKDSVGVFYRKRARRIVVPWLAWSVLYLFLVAFYEVDHPSGTSAMTIDFLRQITGAGPWALLYVAVFPMYYHLWFLYAIIWIYLLVPLWRRVLLGRRPATLWAVAAGWGVVASVLAFTGGQQRPLPVTVLVVAFYALAGLLGFPLLGHLLGRIPLSRRLVGVMAPLAVGGTLATIFGTYALTRADGAEVNVTFWGDTPNIIVTAAAVFLLVRYLVESRRANAALPRAVTALSETSFGVYLLHPSLLYALSVGVVGVRATAFSCDPLLAIPLLTIVVLVVSHLVVRGLQRVPYLRAIVG